MSKKKKKNIAKNNSSSVNTVKQNNFEKKQEEIVANTEKQNIENEELKKKYIKRGRVLNVAFGAALVGVAVTTIMLETGSYREKNVESDITQTPVVTLPVEVSTNISEQLDEVEATPAVEKTNNENIVDIENTEQSENDGKDVNDVSDINDELDTELKSDELENKEDLESEDKLDENPENNDEIDDDTSNDTVDLGEETSENNELENDITDGNHEFTTEVEENITPEISDEEDNERYRLITGVDKQVYTVGHMPDGYKNDTEARSHMTTINVPVWKMRDDNTRYSSKMSLPINKELAEEVQSIFEDIYNLDIQFPIKELVGYRYRKVGGVGLVNSKLMSVHSFGAAIDINPGDYDNDYFLGKGNDLRNKENPYCIPDEVIEIFENHGWFWGGNFDISADTMHFQFFGLGFLQYENPDEPFPILKRDVQKLDYDAFYNMQKRLEKLGYLSKAYKSFNKKVEDAVKAFQLDNGIETTGIVNYETWEPLINLTHDMNYVF